MKKIVYILALLCLLTLSGIVGCNTLFLREPEKKMERKLEWKYHQKFSYVEDSLRGNSDGAFDPVWETDSYSAQFVSEKNPDIVVTCTFGEEFSDDYKDELIRKQFRELMYEYSSDYFTGNYYVWIEWDGKYNLLDQHTKFEDYIKDDPKFAIFVYVEEMDREEAIKAGESFVENNEKNGIYCDTYIGKNIGYDSELFSSWMNTNLSNFTYFDEGIEKIYDFSYAEKYRKEFKKLIEDYSKDYYVGDYYVWIDCKNSDRVGKTTFDLYIKDSERYDIYIFVQGMNDEEANKATEEFRLFLREKGLYHDCWAARNTMYNEEDFKKLMDDDSYEVEPRFDPSKYIINP